MYKSHQKVFARVMAKDYLHDVRASVLRVLTDQGVFRDPARQALEGQVVPWVYDTTAEMLDEDLQMDLLLSQLCEGACDQIIRRHGDALQKERDKRAKKRHDDHERAEEHKRTKEKMRLEREEQKRRDDLHQLQVKVEQQVVEKGEWLNEILKQDLTNVHGDLQSTSTVCAVGGLLTQIAVALTATASVAGKSEFVNPKSMYVFIATYLADCLKSEHLDVYMGPALVNLAKEKGAKLEELQNLDAETAKAFEELYSKGEGCDDLQRLVRSKADQLGFNVAFFAHLEEALLKLLMRKLSEKDAQGIASLLSVV